MIEIYRADAAHTRGETATASALPPEAIWIDLLDPTKEEEQAVERLCGIEVPTREEMREIEVSSRLYSEDNADFMTVSVVFGLDTTTPAFAPVTFILAGHRLVTLRYSKPKSFAIYAAKLCRDSGEGAFPASGAGENGQAAAPKPAKAPTADAILIGLMETIIDRMADLLEAIAADLDRTGAEIFSPTPETAFSRDASFKMVLKRIGAAGDVISKTRESLATFHRLMPYLQFVLDRRRAPKDARARIKAMTRDLQSLNDYDTFLSNKTTFLLDTTVGMISIEQNAIIKIFSVAAVGFMPPTLVASIYGMNFRYMPELDWTLGYPLAIGLMILSAVLPLLFFRYKGWL